MAAIVLHVKPLHMLLRDLWVRSRPWAIICTTLSAAAALVPLGLVIGSGVAAYYLAGNGEAERVVAAAVLAAVVAFAADAFRRSRPWRRVVLWRLGRYAPRPGDKAVQLLISGTDIARARRALRKAGYIVDVPPWRTTDQVQLDARHREHDQPLREPNEVLETEGIEYRRVGNSTTIGPAW